MADFYNAYVCERGHINRSDVGLEVGLEDEDTGQRSTEPRPPDSFCDECGATVLAECPICESTLRGARIMNMGLPDREFQRPRPYCYQCGEPLPWTRDALNAIEELALEQGDLSDAEVGQLVDAARRLSDETLSPQSTVGVSRFRRLVGRMSGETREAVMKIGVDLASAAIKKELGTG